ncbi:hypothetical protein [Novosphingobium album (ex Hu et al. 2023)]|uniref:Uncharacterized protein n=1 Tax=Novosphingobium album (ex Hu et al. 2023) TaxID=2930093 RepID=A0ABT0AZH7_9SPHN|nr:hypothetical protein [Novosphingobium album (ex Hu et al. 2023)]MCJ2178111.1 hypothetical protein [Novosphingobium album (ex Hu et al. 2023)]
MEHDPEKPKDDEEQKALGCLLDGVFEMVGCGVFLSLVLAGIAFLPAIGMHL